MNPPLTDASTVDRDRKGDGDDSTDGTALAPRTARWLEIQGFNCSRRPDADDLVPWLRFSPGLTTGVVVLGTVMASPLVLGALSLVTGTCAVTPRHPFDLVYDRAVRPVTGTLAIPRTPVPRRFACGIATVWLVTTAVSFWVGAVLLGNALGAVLVLLGALVATSHRCVGSLVYRLLEGRVIDRPTGR